MNELNRIAQRFDPITLAEMDAVKLMDRMDTKFTFHISCLDKVLEQLMPHYRLLEVDGVRRCRYENLYYDTSDFLFYKHHHNGKKNRYKIRFRNYMDSSLHFFEVKYSSNKDRTIKERIKVNCIPERIDGEAGQFLEKHTPYSSSVLFPLLKIYYTRMTLVSKSGAERVTIDTDLSFSNEKESKTIPGLVIAEAKQDRCCRSAFSDVMRNMKMNPGSISKYCYGMIHLYPHLKKNIFKPRLRTLNTLCYDTH